MELIDRFGDVPWVDTPLDDTSEEAYGSRMPRIEVADKVLERLLWAESNIGDAATYMKKDGSNTINQDCVRAAISRFTLREGTWRKYHELGSYDRYFTECKRVSQLLMQDYPSLYKGTDGQPMVKCGLRIISAQFRESSFTSNGWKQSNRDIHVIMNILLHMT